VTVTRGRLPFGAPWTVTRSEACFGFFAAVWASTTDRVLPVSPHVVGEQTAGAAEAALVRPVKATAASVINLKEDTDQWVGATR
jgi:hypothetical protein